MSGQATIESRRAITARRASVAASVAAIVVTAAAVAFVARRAPAGEAVGRAIVEALTIGVPVAVGLFAVRSTQHRRFGLLLLGAGFAYSMTALGEASDSVAYSIGRVAAWLLFPFMLYLLLSYPDGRPGPGLERRLFTGGTLLIALLYLGSALFVEDYPRYTPWASCVEDCPPNAFLVLDAEPAVMRDFVQPARELIAAVLVSAITVSLVRRWRAATPARRSLLGPVVIAGAIWNAALVVFFVVRRAEPSPELVKAVGLLWSISLAGVAAGFFVGLLRRRLLLGRVLAELSGLLSAQTDPRGLRDALAAALRDPSLDVLIADRDRWRDSRGRIAPAPSANGSQRLTPISDGGAPALMLVHDRELSDEELVEAAGALVLAGYRHERVKTSLANSLGELEASRRRIAKTADLERSRIERDLHDGAQQRLIALRLKLSSAEEQMLADPGTTLASMRELGDEVERAIDDLRALAHGVYPPLLNSFGLGDALRGLAAQSPVPVHLHIAHLSRHPAEIETAVYFTCAEALQNAVKHAFSATGVWITVRQEHALTFEIRDDGVGFDTFLVESHAGLRNMRDRIEAIGGGLTIDASPGHGTRIIGFVTLAAPAGLQ